MSRQEVLTLTRKVTEICKRLSEEPRLQAELQRARRQFFGEDDALVGNEAAEHRFAEWFLLERECDSLGAVPATVPPYAAEAEALQGTLSGAFVVLSIGTTVTARDVQDQDVIELADGEGLIVGDLIVGRMYPVSGERFAASLAAPVLRPGEVVAKAFRSDLERLELDRRLQQIELEHLLLRQQGGGIRPEGVPLEDPPAPLEHLEADLEQLLASVGDKHSATILSQQLAVAQRPGALIGPLLDQLAFDTDVDLDKARKLMLEIWNAHHTGSAPSTEQQPEQSKGPPGESLGERLVRELDEGLGQKRNVEELFAQLENIAGIEPDEEDAAEEQRAAELVQELSGGKDAGDLEPLVTEYLWETGRAEAGERDDGPLSLWVELQQNAPVPRVDIESITANDLMRLLLHVYLRAAPDQRAAEVRAAFDELGRFYEWILQTQEIDKQAVLQECKGVLLEQLERLQAAGVHLSNDDAPNIAPGLLQIEDIAKNGFGARDDDGNPHWLDASEQAIAQLQVGDLVLGGIRTAESGDDRNSRLAGLIVVLPMDARALIE